MIFFYGEERCDQKGHGMKTFGKKYSKENDFQAAQPLLIVLDLHVDYQTLFSLLSARSEEIDWGLKSVSQKSGNKGRLGPSPSPPHLGEGIPSLLLTFFIRP